MKFEALILQHPELNIPDVEEAYQVIADFAPCLCRHTVVLKPLLEDVVKRGAIGNLSQLKLFLDIQVQYQRSRPNV